MEYGRVVGPGVDHFKFDLDQCSHGKSLKLSKYPLKTQCLDMKLRSKERRVRRQEILSSESAHVLVRRSGWGWLWICSQSFSCMEGTLATRRLQSSSALVRNLGALLYSCMYYTYDIIEDGQMWGMVQKPQLMGQTKSCA